MDFASEPVRDAFPLPQTRPAQANAAPPDDNGRSFDDHLEAVNEPRPERAAPPQNEAREDPAAPVGAGTPRADEAEASEERIDADTALLGGPFLPLAPPPIAAPVAVQIALSQSEPAPQTQPQSDDALLAPLNTPTPAPPTLPEHDAEMADAAEPAAPSAATAGKSTDVHVKDPAPKAAQADDVPQAQTTTQTQATQAETDSTLNAAQQTANAPVATTELPQAVQQAIAATIASAPQATTQTTARATNDAAQAIDAKSAPNVRDGKPEAPISTAKAQANAAKSGDSGKTTIDTAPASPTQSAAPDTPQIAENSAITTTTAQASTQVQHAAAETGAQRSAPAAAQVGREIIRRFNGGTTSFELRLDPADLGRVEVRMEVTRDHRVTAVITADNPQALTELARGARELEQHLQSAGLQLSENGLSFDLRQGAQGGGDAEDANANARGNRGEILNEQQAAPVARPIGYERWRGVRVDMMV